MSARSVLAKNKLFDLAFSGALKCEFNIFSDLHFEIYHDEFKFEIHVAI